uniref:Genome polyprotein n=1 Tax=Darwin bee virus 4 TaxID=2201279 RepID=A0A2U8JQ86_9VIRU|nr:polyprotein [Darwin bee virus 4]
MFAEIEQQYYNVLNQSGVRKSVNFGGDGSGGNISKQKGEKTVYSSRDAIAISGSKRLGDLLASNDQEYSKVSSYTDLFNSWLSGMFPIRNITKTDMFIDECGRRGWTVRRTIVFATTDGTVVFDNENHSFSMKFSLNATAKFILDKFLVAKVQSDETPSKESIQGDATQKSDKENNTIVTRDQQQTVSSVSGGFTADVARVSSSEPTHRFPMLVSRWMPIDVLHIKTTSKRGDYIASYYLPETFLSEQAKCAPNTIPFETFVYGQYDISMKFVVNANKFHCGKVIVSVKFDSYQADDINNGFQAALSRPHIILDLSANNEGTIDVPFRYHRAFVRNQTHATATVGIRPGKYASVYVQILSPLLSGPGGANDMDIRPYYMYKRAEFAGMSYKVPLTQMDVVSELAKALPTRGLKEMIVGVEKSLDQLGKSLNQDKPTQNAATIVIPRPRLCFPHGKGLSDAVAMRMNPTALTSFGAIKGFPDDPKTTLDIARIWGLRSTFSWSNSKAEGTELFNAVIDPTCRKYGEDYDGQPTPLEYAASIYNFWSGPIELRFDFVSNSFHTGAVLISAEFNRTSTDTDECQSYSTYTKTFHLGDQKSVSFVVPYIYDTVMRRSTTLPYCPIIDTGVDTSDDIKKTAIGVRAESKMRVKVRVINALRPVASAPQEIEVLVFMRAGKNFVLHGLTQCSFWDSRDIVPLDSFPSDNYLPVKPKTKRDTTSQNTMTEKEKLVMQHRYLPSSVANKWNEQRTYPRTQMDTGEKENEDPTDNFSDGISSFGVQNNDSQVGIKDILRRPVLLFDSVTIDGTSTGFFIPLMPPSRMMQYDRAKKQSTKFQHLVGVTPQAALMNLFRFWRGSMRYTILIHDGSAAPVYITHVPHSGIRKFDIMKVNETVDLKAPIYGCGLTTEVMIPVVNPSICVEAPFDTENNWCLTFDEDALRNYSWRDKSDVVSGHLVISSRASVTISVWWSAGDDFEVANFYGIPATVSNHWKYEFSDEHARVQMDEVVDETGGATIRFPRQSGFRVNNVATSVGMLYNGIKKVATPERVVNTALCMIPGLGSAYATATVLDSVGAGVNKALDTTQGVARNVNAKIEELSAKMGHSMDYITQIVQESVNTALGTMQNAATYASYCYDVILDILIAWVDKSWTAIGVGIVRFITKIVGVKMVAGLMDMALQLGLAIGEYMRPQHARTQAPPERAATVTGILAGIIGTVMGVRLSPSYGCTYWQSMLLRMTESRGISYLMVMLKFVEATFATIRDMVMHALGYVSPEHTALKMLSGSSSILDTFITEAQLMTTEANSALVQDPVFRYRFWSVVMQAYQIQKLLATVPTANASPILSRLCSDLIKVSNEKFVDISASPVRYEPIVICIEGAAGIGKSELTEYLVTHLLKGINLQRPHSGATYFRMPGARFWSGYRDQPVVVYDDWVNLTDPTLLAQHVSELYQLKSTATFIPEMAHLEEKKIRGNPLIVILLCNEAFPHNALSSLAHTPEAIYRRRDILLRANLKEEFVGQPLRDMGENAQVSFDHLEFAKYQNPTDRKSLGKKKVNFEETRKFLVEKVQKWHAQEQIKVKRRLNNIRAGMCETPVNSINLEDPFQLYYSVSTNLAMSTDQPTNGFLPSEILAAEVRRIANALENHQREDITIVVPPEPRDPFVPEVQGDFFRPGALKAITLGILTSRMSIYNILNASSKLLTKALDYLLSKHAPLKECSVCGEEGEMEWYCVDGEQMQGFEQATHYVCAACVRASYAAGAPITTCPVCRSDKFERWRVQERLLAMSLLARTAAKCLLTTEQIVSYAMRLFAYDSQNGISYALSSVLRLGAALTSTITTDTSYREAYNSFALGTYVDMGEAIVRSEIPMSELVDRFAEFQLDPFAEGEEEEVDPEPSTSTTVVDALKCTISVRRLEFLSKEVRTSEHPCLHQLLIDNVHAARYAEGKFIVPCDGRTLYISEYPCSAECSFTDQLVVGRFYKSLLENHSHVFDGAVIGYINCHEGKEFHRNKIPFVLRPDWMKDCPALNEEVQVLTAVSWWEKLSDQWANYKYMILTIGGVITAIGGVMALHKVFSGAPRAMAEYIGSGDEATRNLRRTTRTLQRVRTNRPHFQEVQEQPELDTVVKQYIARNYLTIALYKEKGRVLMTACGIYGHKALLPRHYVKAIRKAAEAGIKITVGPALLQHEWKEYTFDKADFITSDTTDLSLWTLPASFGMFKDIRKFMATDEDLQRPITTDGCILLAPTRVNPVLKEQSVEILGLQNSQSVEDNDGEFFEAHDVICYTYSQPGACGSLVMLSRTQRPIVAMHFAGLGPHGTSGEGFGVILTKETLGEIGQVTHAVTQLEDWGGPSLEDAKILFEDTNVHYIGAVPKEQIPFAPKKSKIRPSAIQGVNGLQPLTEPCILDKTDKRYEHEDTPLVAGCKKHGQLTRDFKTTQIERAAQGLWDGWISKMKPLILDPARLTPEQAASGLIGVEYYDPMVLNTSAGFPYVTTEKKAKSDYITFITNEQKQPIGAVIDDTILNELRRKEELRKQGIQPITPFIDTLKDERKKKEKVKKYGATRVFCNPPIDYVIAMRQNYLHFTSSFMKNRMNLMHAVGINLTGTEWTLLANKLIDKSFNNISTIDYSNFGPGFNAHVASYAMELMVRWTMENVGEVNESELRTLLHECLNSVHLCHNTLYQQKCGSPSGAPITVVINTLVNLLYIMIAWESLTAEKRKEDGMTFAWEEFRKSVAIFCYGDDLIMSVVDKYKEIFNTITITKFFAEYGIVATDASKSEHQVANTPITQATFLKHSFRKHERHSHLWQSSLDWTSINDTTQWIWECADVKLATRENCEAALLQAHGHGKRKFENFKAQINGALIKKNIQPLTLGWEEVDNKFYPELNY